VPLGDRAIEILRVMEAIRSGDLIFAIGRVAMWDLLGRLDADVSVSGFRSCFKEWARDLTDHSREVVELTPG